MLSWLLRRFIAEIWPSGFRGEIYHGVRELEDEVNAKKLNQLNELVSKYLAKATAARVGSAS